MFNEILIPVDLAHEAQLPQLVLAARKLLNIPQGRISLLFVDESQIHRATYPFLNDDTFKQHKIVCQGRLKSLLCQFVAEAQHGRCVTRRGAVYEQILEESRKQKSNAIVMMAGTPGLSNYFLGSNAEKVVRHADCSVFVLRPRTPQAVPTPT